MNIFNTISSKKPRSSVFDLSHEVKMSLNMGDLIPFYVEHTLPGDKFKLNAEIFMRLAPMISPVMHRVNVFTHFFAVPYRLIFKDSADFLTGGEQGDAVVSMPTINYSQPNGDYFLAGSLADYLGIPPYVTGSGNMVVPINALAFRAYQRIYNDYYRDQNLIDPVLVRDTQTVLGDELASIMKLRKRAWEKDYFTSALPWAQKGPDVTIPFTTEYPAQASQTIDPATGLPMSTGPLVGLNGTLTDGSSNPVFIDSSSGITTKVNDLRRSLKLQEWLEKNARGGSRYIEQILSHFGVMTPDYRLQRAEYLGGGRAAVQISEVLQTTQEVGPLGTMGGHGVSVGNSNSFTKYFNEHCVVIGILSVMPRTAYQQGIDRHFQKFDKFDFAWPSFANLGEQAILNSEIYLGPDTTTEEAQQEFGYTPRYAEYKYKASRVCGDFREGLAYWHMGRLFAEKPELNEDFVTSDPTNRIFAVEEDFHHLYSQIYVNCKASRPLPYFGTPSI